MNDLNKTSRRGVMRTGLGLLAAGAAAVGTARAQDVKIAKNLIQYQDGPKDGLMCNKCVNWVAPNACKIVEGTINPNGWCAAYAPKEG